MIARGLVTLERAQFGGTVAPPDATKLTIYVGRQERVDGRPAYRAVCDAAPTRIRRRLSVSRCRRHRPRRAGRASFFSRNMGIPVMIIAVGTGEQVAEALPELERLLRQPLLTIERAQCASATVNCWPIPALPAPTRRPGAVAEADGLHLRGRLHGGRRSTARSCEAVRLWVANGATVLRGIWGFYGDHKPHGDKMVQLARRVPVTTVVVDSAGAHRGELRPHRRAHRADD